MQLAALETGQRKTKLSNNARAVRSYAKHFAEKVFEVLEPPRFFLNFANVAISVYPDLYVVEGRKEKLIRLDFHKVSPTDEAVKISTQTLFEAAEQAGLGLISSCILYFDLSSGTVRRGARMGSRMSNEIEAACQNIAAIWDTL